MTLFFEKYVIELMRFATIEHTAKFLGVSWSLVKSIHQNYLQNEYRNPDLQSVQYIGVDEFSIHKGHEYMTIFINFETGEIIHAVEGKSIEKVTPFFLHLQITNAKTEGINNKIKTMKRQAYGFRDMEYFKLRLYNLHKVRYSFAR